MQSPRSKVGPLPNCSWCCGDLRLVGLRTGPRVMCIHCGRAPPEARSESQRQMRALSLATTMQIPGHAREDRQASRGTVVREGQ